MENNVEIIENDEGSIQTKKEKEKMFNLYNIIKKIFTKNIDDK